LVENVHVVLIIKKKLTLFEKLKPIDR